MKTYQEHEVGHLYKKEEKDTLYWYERTMYETRGWGDNNQWVNELCNDDNDDDFVMLYAYLKEHHLDCTVIQLREINALITEDYFHFNDYYDRSEYEVHIIKISDIEKVMNDE
ncbi:MAG: hypothetical protein COA52_00360 [Hyphomicrobiales bacterium]|nr:MAG: hypothetical protein COA52_00360 [Hyphomicrobiales bacterium]